MDGIISIHLLSLSPIDWFLLPTKVVSFFYWGRRKTIDRSIKSGDYFLFEIIIKNAPIPERLGNF
jgi:hypothetical protein